MLSLSAGIWPKSALTSFITRRWETIRHALNKSFRQRKERSDFIIFSGGLGPTKDDLTKETIAEVVGRPLKLDDEAFESIQDYFKKTNREMSPNNRKQALILEGSDVLPNRFGMAPGIFA